jgi:hypothetical protein
VLMALPSWSGKRLETDRSPCVPVVGSGGAGNHVAAAHPAEKIRVLPDRAGHPAACVGEDRPNERPSTESASGHVV